MLKHTVIFFALSAGFCARAQQYPRLFEKAGLKALQEAVTYIPTKTVMSPARSGGGTAAFQPGEATIPGFFMRETEVTNSEYRQFVEYVRDSIAHRLLGHYAEAANRVDWQQPIAWDDSRLRSLLMPAAESFSGAREIDPATILYTVNRESTAIMVAVYPDTLVWMRDFPYAMAESLSRHYFSDPFYNNYPVVGVSLQQALAFCQWKSAQLSRLLKGEEYSFVQISLPTHAQWQAAAFEKRDTLLLPLRNKNYRYNYGTGTGTDRNLSVASQDDGFIYTAPVKSFPPGSYELYDMKGNVAEWTCTPMEEVMKTEVQTDKMQRRYVVKGGGWNSPLHDLRASVCQFFPATASHAYIGFRYVVELKRSR